MSYETLLYRVDGPIATITLNRPERLNTIVPADARRVRRRGAPATADAEVQGDRAARRRPLVLRRL